MAWAITTLGTASNNGNAVITVGVGGVPAGSIIVAVTNETGNSLTTGSVSDSATNTYTSIVNQLNGNVANKGVGQVHYAKNSAALVNTNTITYNRAGAGTALISAAYLTGGDTTAPLDTAVTASSFAVIASPAALTSGTPAVSGEMFIAAVTADSAAAFTQDTGNGWAAPPDSLSAGAIVAGGNQVNAGTGTKSWAPTFAMNTNTALFIVGFKLATTTVVPEPPQIPADLYRHRQEIIPAIDLAPLPLLPPAPVVSSIILPAQLQRKTRSFFDALTLDARAPILPPPAPPASIDIGISRRRLSPALYGQALAALAPPLPPPLAAGTPIDQPPIRSLTLSVALTQSVDQGFAWPPGSALTVTFDYIPFARARGRR